MADHHIHPTPAGDNIVQRIVNAWDCCGTCAGGVYAAAVHALVERAKAEALREAGVWLAGQRNPVTGRRKTNAELFGHMVYERGNEIDYQAERRARADSLATQPAPEAATVEEPHCSTCTCGCTCGYGGLHDPENPNCDLVRRKP